ncbi:glycerate kinase family protein [Sorangium sp. So ce1151]|uniref:glycerate kinase family protein n=1 Tax=Sorangium sp. So ce1151 TaxID=3133332 RepID=UPI003F5F74E4
MTSPLRILIAPSGFKECLGAEQVAEAIATGIRRALPGARLLKAPLTDGGEGFSRALVQATGGSLYPAIVTGPLGQPVASHFGFLGGAGPRTAVIEMAAAAGLRLVPPHARNPMVTTTRGVGELLRAALDAGAEQLLIGCGDSGTNDGGAGMAQALGIRLLNAAGIEIGAGGGALLQLDHIDLSGRDARISRVRIDVACNWRNVLCNPGGVARVFGPQKGASPEMVALLEAALERYAAIIARDVGVDVRAVPGGGASGGLGAGLHALLEATLLPRYDVLVRYLDLDGLLRDADLVVTAEGGLDGQTSCGKMPAELARRAKHFGLPVIALAGTIDEDARVNYACGIDSFSSILEAPCTLSEAMDRAPFLIANAAENALRYILIGRALPGLRTARGRLRSRARAG